MKKTAVIIIAVMCMLMSLSCGKTGTSAPSGPMATATPMWKTVGTVGFSLGEVEDTSLYVYNGTPYRVSVCCN